MINIEKLLAECEHHIKRGDGVLMMPEVVRDLANLTQAARETLEQNLHLADGQNCTLKTLRDAYLKINPKWGQE